MASSGLPSILAGARDRWGELSARIVARPGFRQFAARFPLTRFVARRRTRALFDLAAGFVYSQVLAAFVRLDLHEMLHDGPRSLSDIARRTGLSDDRALRLLRAAATLGLCAERPDGLFRLGETGAALVGNDGVLAMIAHHELLYDDLADPVALLRGGRPTRLSRFWTYGDEAGVEAAAAYSRLMARSQAMIASEVLAALPLMAHRRLLDVGGGAGAFAILAARRYPHLEVALLDLPPVAELARQAVAAAGLAARIAVHGGSVLQGVAIPAVDVVTFNRVLHDHDDGAVQAMLRAAHSHLLPGGLIAVCEPMAGTPGAEPAGDAYFGFYLLAMGQGRPRRFEEIAAMMAAAGFTDIRELATATPLIVRVATGRKAAA